MPGPNRWYREPSVWLEAFVIVNLAFLSLDIYLAHSTNRLSTKRNFSRCGFHSPRLPCS